MSDLPPAPPPPPAAEPTPPPGSQRTRTRTPLSEVPSPYGLWIALFAVLIFSAPNLLLLGLTGTEAAQVGDIDPGLMVLNIVVGMVLQLIVFGIALLPLLAAGRPYRRLLGPTKTTPAMVAIGVVAGIAAFLLSYTLNAIALVLAGSTEPVEQQLLRDALAGGTVLVLVAVMAVVVAPLVEEVIFRGVLFRALADRLNLAVGVVVSSAVFAVIHLEVVVSQPLALIGLFTVGAVLAVAYHLTGNLGVAIIGHAVFNATSLGLAVGLDRLDLEDLVERLEATMALPWHILTH